MLPILLAALESEAEQRFFHQFYHKYKTDFYRYALSILRDPHGAEEGDYRSIVALIRAMPEQYRTILELKFVLEWPDKAIAKALQLPATTVSTRISRGRKLLQTQLIKEEYWNETR